MPRQPLPVDEEGGGTGRPSGRAAREVDLDPGAIGPVAKRRLGFRRVQPESTRHLEQPIGCEFLATGEQQRVRLPESALRRGELGELRGAVGAGMKLGIGEVAPDQPQLVKALKQGFDRPLCGEAVRATEVSVLDQSEARALGAADVVPLRDRSEIARCPRARVQSAATAVPFAVSFRSMFPRVAFE
jgi:hypothetical protein